MIERANSIVQNEINESGVCNEDQTSILFIAILTLSGCAQAIRSEQPANTLAPAGPVVTAVVTQAEATSKIEAMCVRNS